MPLRDARRIYFDANHFGEDGGYGAKWVDFKLGQIPFPIPNAPSRVRPVRFHDLHHVLTGYDTSTIGEFEISAWEIAAGCRGFAAAWVLHLSGMFAGMLVAPRRTFLAFVRGRRSRTLYGETLRPLARRDSERRPCAVPAGRRRRPGERCGRRRSWRAGLLAHHRSALTTACTGLDPKVKHNTNRRAVA
jgi:hypothetical protein